MILATKDKTQFNRQLIHTQLLQARNLLSNVSERMMIAGQIEDAEILINVIEKINCLDKGI